MDTVLRRTPFKVLRWFLRDVGIHLDFDWEQMHTCDLPKVISAYRLIPPEQKEKAEVVVREIVSLADQEGMAAMNEAVKICGLSYMDLMFKAYPSAYLQAIWLWSNHREVFVQARNLLQANRAVYFRKRSGLPTGIPPLTDETLASLKEHLQIFFTEKQKRGKVCTVEAFERSDGRFCIAAYPDDQPIPYLEHKQDELVPVMVNPVFEVLFDLEVNTGTLAVSAKLGKAVKKELENLFIRTVYGIEPPPLDEPCYDVAKLKDSRFRLTTEPSDAVSAEVGFIGLKWREISTITTFSAVQGISVFQGIKELIRKEKRNLDVAEVRRAAIRFHFQRMTGRRAGILCAELTPTNLTLRCKDAVRIEIIHKYLKQWEIMK